MIEFFFLLMFISTQLVFCGDKPKSGYNSNNRITSITNTKNHSSSSASGDDSSSMQTDDSADYSGEQDTNIFTQTEQGINDTKLSLEGKKYETPKVQNVDLKRLEKEKQLLEQKLIQSDQTNCILNKKNSELIEEKKALYSNINPLENTITELRKKIQLHEGNNDNNFPRDNEQPCDNLKLNFLSKENMLKTQTIQKLQEELAEVERNLKAVKINLVQLEQQNQELKNRADESEMLKQSVVDTLNDKLQKLQSDYNEIESELQQKNQHLKENEQEIADLKNKTDQPPQVITVFHTPWTYKAATGFFALTTGVALYAAYLFYKQKKV